jgi:uncharacterized repeat protein (TIGR01451 family)
MAAYPRSSDPTDPNDNQEDDDDNGTQANTGDAVFSPVFNLTPGAEPTDGDATNPESGQGNDQDNIGLDANGNDLDANGDMTIDFGFIPVVSVGSTVFTDLDNDGQYEPVDGENGIPGVVVELYTAAGDFVGSTTTDDNGDYFFGDLPEGMYQLVIPTPPLEYPSSSTVTDNMDNGEDNDDNGMQTNSGDPVSSPIFTLMADTEPTDSDPLNPESGQGTEQDDADDDNGDMTQDFGFVPSLSIGSFVWADDNNNGMFDTGEQPLGDVELELINVGPDGVYGTADDVSVGTTTTDPTTGEYLFDGLLPGNYVVTIPADNFGTGEPLEDYQLSSTPTDTADNREDDDDNGIQDGGAGTIIVSPVIELATGTEPTNEPGAGGDQDDAEDANGDMTIDFGLIPAVSVGSTVWADDNNNGVQDGTEAGIEGITVVLYSVGDDGLPNTADDVLVGTDDTDINGDYFFGGLPEGDYYLVIPTTPVDYPLSSTFTEADPNADTDSNDNGDQPGGAGTVVSSGVVTLTADTEPTDGINEGGQGNGQDNADDDNGNMTVDFGFIPAVSVGSTVWIDQNNNGVQDAGEMGIPDVTVELYSVGDDGLPNTADDVLVSTDDTDADGDYFFGGLPEGDYYLVIPMAPEDYPRSSTFTEADPDADTDSNDNGAQPGGSGTAVSSGVVTLTAGDEPEDTDTEPENGQGTEQDDANDANGNMTVDFGFIPVVSVGSTVFSDLDNDGTHEPGDGENGIPGVTVQLFEENDNPLVDAPFAEVITDANGNYFFGGLPEGDYFIYIPMPADAWPISSTPTTTDGMDNTDGDDNGSQATPGGPVQSPVFNLALGMEPVGGAESGSGGEQDGASGSAADANGNMTFDFGFFPSMSIGSVVWFDENNNGVYDEATEAPIGEVLVELYTPGPDGIVGTTDDVFVSDTTTDPTDGTYFFGDLAPGDYYVSLPASNFATGAAAEAYPLSSTPTNENDDQMDNDDNGIQEGGIGTVINSPVINLTPSGEPVNESGAGGAQDGQLSAGDQFDDNGDMTIDFGLIPAVSVGSTVWADDNNNGVQDGTEAGIEGITVVLYSVGDDGLPNTADDVLVGTDDTDINGDYFFGGLPEGDYYLVIPTTPVDYPLSSTFTEADPNADTDSNDNGDQPGGAGTVVSSGVVTLTADTEPTDGINEGGQGNGQDNADDNNGNMTVDFGFTPEVSVGSTVFLDENNNGFQDDGDVGIPGVVVQLFDDEDNLIATDTTDSNGDYFFGGLFEGEYYIVIPASENFGPGDALEGTPLSSVPTDEMDNGEDEDDNGIQTGGQGTDVVSPNFILTADDEQEDEVGQGGTQDNADDNNGDMTIDFGFPPLNFDLALLKRLAADQPMSVEPGDTVYYDITVVNQGNLAADNIEVTDYIPANMRFETGVGANAGWMPAADQAGPGQVTFFIDEFDGADSLGIGESVTLRIALTIDSPLLPPGTILRNEAEISEATDEFGTEQEDIDSSPDNNDTNDNELVDNDVSGNANEGGDEDDHDWAEVVIEGFDLALLKVLADDQPSLVRPGDTLHYRIRVINQGMIAADQIEIVDYLPADGALIYQGGVAGNDDAGWSLNGDGNPIRTLSVANGGLTAALEPGEEVEVSIFLTLNNPLPAGTTVDNFAEIAGATDENGDPQDDIDSTPDEVDDDVLNNDNDVSGNGNDGEDEDDHDIATVEILPFDVALIKELADGQGSVVAPGDTVRYTITVFNQGEIPADNIEITDYVPASMTYDAGYGDGVTDNATLGWDDASGNPQNTLTIDGGLAPGASTTIDIFLRLNNPLPAGVQVDNFAEISDATDENGDEQTDDDSELDNNPDDDDLTEDNETGGDGDIPGEDDDDHDVASITTAIFDVALIKELADGQSSSVEPGDTVAYTITVFNQGDIAADNIEISDYIPSDMMFEAGAGDGTTDNATIGWVLSTTPDGDVATTTLTIDGGLQPGTSTTVDIYLTLNSPLLPPGTVIDNFAEISGATDDTGDEQEDIDSDLDADPNDDDLTEDNETGGDGSIPGEDDDDHDVASITIEGFDLALLKVLADDQPSLVRPGDTLHYRIRVINQGMIAADQIEIVDYLPADGALIYQGGVAGNDDAGWSLNGDGNPIRTLSVANGGLTAALEPGEEVEVSIFLTLNNPLPAGTTVDNFAEIAGATDENGDPQDDIDSTPDEVDDDVLNNDNDVSGNGNDGEDEDDHDIATVEILPFDVALIKELADGQGSVVAPGDTVRYTITVFNQGEIPADNIEITDYVPASMTYDAGYGDGVTDNATLGWDDASGNPQNTLTIDGGLAPGSLHDD